jgi:hypothetical protein
MSRSDQLGTSGHAHLPNITCVRLSTVLAVRGGQMFSPVACLDQRSRALAHARVRVLRARELLGSAAQLHEVAQEMSSLRREVAPVGLMDIAVLARAVEGAAQGGEAGEKHPCLPQAAHSLDLLLALVELDSGCR